MRLTGEELEALISKAAAAGARAAYQQAKKQSGEKTDHYRDTFNVLKNYRDARFFMDHAADEEAKLKTSLKLQHIDAAIEEMRKRREAQGRGIEYEAFKLYFVDGLDYEAIAERLDTSKNTPRRWVTSITSELATMLWGYDGEL